MRLARRSFVAGAFLAGAAWGQAKSRVVVARDAALRKGGSGVDSARLAALADRAVQAFYGRDSALDAWKQIAKPGEVVGLKVNCLSGRGAATSVGLVDVISERLQQAGIPAKDIVIWDRLDSDLESAGFRPGARRIRCVGNDTAGYEPELTISGNAASMISRTLTRICDAVVNLPVLKDHGIAGVTLALKNAFGAIHNPNKYHPNVCDPYVADVNMFEPIRRKVRLTICDGTVAQYEGGPPYMPQWTWPFNGLLVARDPVALDYTGWRIIEAVRAEKGFPPLKAARREPVYISTAADRAHRLGTNDPRQIEKVEL